jgi:CheY-like chemotaxis protein
VPTILIVDDEPTILRLASLALSRQFRVLTAESGDEGLALLATEPVDLLLTDHRMPEMTGAELVRRARADHPDLPCILSTGFTEEAELRQVIAEGDVKVLYKPWSPTDLRGAVASALEPGA